MGPACASPGRVPFLNPSALRQATGPGAAPAGNASGPGLVRIQSDDAREDSTRPFKSSAKGGEWGHSGEQGSEETSEKRRS